MTNSLKAALFGILIIAAIALGTLIMYMTQPASQLTGLGQSSKITKGSQELNKYVGVELSGEEVRLAIKKYKDTYSVKVTRGARTILYDSGTDVPSRGDADCPLPTETYRATLDYTTDDAVIGITFKLV